MEVLVWITVIGFFAIITTFTAKQKLRGTNDGEAPPPSPF